MKKTFLFLCLLAAPFSLRAAYTGHVYVDKNGNGMFDKGEKPMKGILVSDGMNVVETASDGSFTLPGHARERFIFITTPSGYKTFNQHYHKIVSRQDGYDFGLTPNEGGIGKGGAHKFVHITDTEIFNTTGHEDWVNNIRNYVINEEAAFIIHTGDICYEKGLKAHIKLMNTENMGCPVFYCIGNHDLVKGKYGEELFESIYGPVYYSFDAGNVHYVVTPMPGGDHSPGYTPEDVYLWLKNDLAHVQAGKPVIIFNHDLLTQNDSFVFKGESGSINLNEHNLKAWIYGHWHINYMKKQGDVYSICTGTLDKGGIDHSTSAYRVMSVDKKGKISSDLRYTYLDKNLCIAAPAGIITADKVPVIVNTYSSVSPVKEVVYDCLLNGKPIVRNKQLQQATDWTWTGEMPLNANHQGKELTLQITARFRNGETAFAETVFTARQGQSEINLTDNWDNLLGNAAHTAPVYTTALDTPLQLAWAKNIGANIYMASPLIHNGKIYIASVDENLRGEAAVYAFDGKTGQLLWRYPVRNSVKNTIAIESDLIFAQDAEGFLYALDGETGKLRWEKHLPVNGLPALIDGLVTNEGIVYAGTGKGLGAYEAKTGKLLWQNKEWGQGEGTTTTLTQGNGLLIGSAQWNALYGNDSKTGKKLWSASDNGLRNRGASAAMHGALLYLTSSQSFFILEAATGKVVVRKPLPYNVDVTSTPLLTDQEIIFGTAQKGLVALDHETLEEKWVCPVGDALVYTSPYTRKVSATIETSPILVGKTVYVAASDGNVYGINKEDGKIVWKHSTGAPIFSSVAVSGNTLVVSDFGGNIYTFCAFSPH